MFLKYLHLGIKSKPMRNILILAACLFLFSCSKKDSSTNTNSNSPMLSFKLNGSAISISNDIVIGEYATVADGNLPSTSLIVVSKKNNFSLSFSMDSTALKDNTTFTNQKVGFCRLKLTKDENNNYDGTFNASFVDGTVVSEGVFNNIPKY